MFFYYALGMFGSPGLKLNSYSSSKPKRDTTLLKIGVALVLVPGITIGGALIAVGAGIYFVSKAIKTVGTIAITTAVNIATSPYYLMSWIFSKKEQTQKLTQEMQKHVLTQEEVQEFNKKLKQEIAEDSQTVYVTVKQVDYKKNPQGAIVLALEKQDNVGTVLTVCKKKWSLKQSTQSMQILHKNKLILTNTLVSSLERNHLGIVELQLIKIQTFG